jgi:hypothetical protein
MKNAIYLCICLSILLLSCSISKRNKSGTTTLPEPQSTSFESDEKIIFLGIKVFGDDQYKPVKAVLLGKLISVGRIKTDMDHQNSQADGLQIQFIDASKQVLKTINATNPLIQRAEFVNSAGELQTREVKTKEIEYTLRTMFPIGATHIVIYRIINPESGSTKEIMKVNIFD